MRLEKKYHLKLTHTHKTHPHTHNRTESP